MLWETKYKYIQKYQFASTNQHGDRFKENGLLRVKVAVISCEYDGDKSDMRTLILLSHSLGVPVTYDFSSKPQRMKIEVVAANTLDY
ncbi:MAG: hypothetical protein PVI43_01595 [Candidatus Bathyarchaeota archaeon]|jgi:hypothetical protein